MPISYHDATPLLEALDGPVAPDNWHGGLPFAYHIGPGKTTVHLKVAFNWDIVPCYDVIAKIKGSKFPDEWVIRGNHQDAWVNGAADPISGQAALLEEAKSIGELLKTGWKPDRTLVYCAWDGEEPALIGSTEWVEEHEKELQQKAVVYINSDGNGRGFLDVEGSHALEPLMDEISKEVIDPQTNVSVFKRAQDHHAINAAGDDAKKKILDEKELTIGAMGRAQTILLLFNMPGYHRWILVMAEKITAANTIRFMILMIYMLNLKIPGFSTELRLQKQPDMQF